MNKDIMFSSKTDDWATPQQFFDDISIKFNGFDLDPCADDLNHKCNNYFTKEQNGLQQPWIWKVFCNPPYGRKMWDWIKKASDEIKQDHCELVVMLIPARTDVKWFHDYIYKKENVEIEFIKWRLKFWGSENSAPFPSMLVIFKK